MIGKRAQGPLVVLRAAKAARAARAAKAAQAARAAKGAQQAQAVKGAQQAQAVKGAQQAQAAKGAQQAQAVEGVQTAQQVQASRDTEPSENTVPEKPLSQSARARKTGREMLGIPEELSMSGATNVVKKHAKKIAVGVAGVTAAVAASRDSGESNQSSGESPKIDQNLALFIFLLAAIAHLFSTGVFFGTNIFVATSIYTVVFFMLALAIVFRPDNNSKGKDFLIVLGTFLAMGFF